MTNWSDTPPTVAGTYWVRRRSDGEEQIGTLDGESWYFKWPYEDWFPANNPEQFQFGYRIPTNGEMSQIDRERHALCEVATLCMNTRAIMPEFRDISDYTEVVDILGAFLERLKELPGLIQQFADSGIVMANAIYTKRPERQQAASKQRKDALAKINAILRGAE